MPTFLNTAKYALRKLTGANLISDIDAGFQALADDVDTNMAGWATGPLASRPTSTGGSPGKAGRFYYATDTGQAFLDFGTGWVEVTLGGMPPSVPTASVLAFGGATAPAGYLLCNGAAVDRTTYAALFTAIGTAHGAGNGTTTFNVPDLKGRVPVGAGQGSGLTNRALGSKFGEEDHVLTAAEHAAHTHGPGTLKTESHNHTGLVGLEKQSLVHTHTFDPYDVPGATGGWTLQNMGAGALNAPLAAVASGSGISSGDTGIGGPPAHNHNIVTQGALSVNTGTTASQGSSQAHNNMPPSQAVTYVIKT